MNGLITLLVMIILSVLLFQWLICITNDRVLNLSIGNSTKYNSTISKCGLKK